MSSFWTILLAALLFIICIGVNLLVWQSQIGQVALRLANVVVHLVPPFIWLGGGIIVVLWLVVLRYLWR